MRAGGDRAREAEPHQGGGYSAYSGFRRRKMIGTRMNADNRGFGEIEHRSA